MFKFLFALAFLLFLFVNRFGPVENCQLLIIRRVYSSNPVLIYRNFAEIIGLLDHIHTYRYTYISGNAKMDSFWVENSFYVVNFQN